MFVTTERRTDAIPTQYRRDTDPGFPQLTKDLTSIRASDRGVVCFWSPVNQSFTLVLLFGPDR
jgi:hypothetical protein